MMHVVTGGSGSGKSAYAEQLVQEYSGKSAYAGQPMQERDGRTAYAEEPVQERGGRAVYAEEPVQGYDRRAAYAERPAQERDGRAAYAEGSVQERAEDIGHEKVLRRIYIATMIPYGKEGARRVARHRRMRQEKQFETIECYTGLSRLRIPERSVVLLECVSNLTANEMYDPSGAGEGTVRAVVDGIQSLHRQAEHLVIVTNEIFSDGIAYDASTMQYMAYLGEINQEIAREADRVTEVVYGIPVRIKDVEDRVPHSGQGQDGRSRIENRKEEWNDDEETGKQHGDCVFHVFADSDAAV